jgi:dimeric dUTPase (all-alpha-NTP-PPase superfamily)
MDIRDIKEPVPNFTGNPIEALYGWQKELLGHYMAIEGLPQFPIPINLKINQILFKDFIGRVVEELGESFESYVACAGLDSETAEYQNHKLNAEEEIADALHFLLETLIYAGIEPSELEELPIDVKRHQLILAEVSVKMWHVTADLMIARNCLKNKPWKQTQMITDIPAFKLNLIRAWGSFIVLTKYLGFSIEYLTTIYWKKNQVNQFRIRSCY